MGPCARPGVCIQCVAGLCRVSRIAYRCTPRGECTLCAQIRVVSSMQREAYLMGWLGSVGSVRVARIARLDAF